MTLICTEYQGVIVERKVNIIITEHFYILFGGREGCCQNSLCDWKYFGHPAISRLLCKMLQLMKPKANIILFNE